MVGSVEPLQRLTRRQLEALETVGRLESDSRGVALKIVARSMAVAPPSALEHIRALEEYALVARRSGKTRLTRLGRACLREYRRHHRVAESLFGRAGLDAQAACSAAREIDLALTHRTVNRLWALQGKPATCPHGEPIGPRSSAQRGP